MPSRWIQKFWQSGTPSSRRGRVQRSIGLGLALAMIGASARPLNWASDLEDWVVPYLFQVRGPVVPPPDVAVVTIDRVSAQQIGIDPREWPPPRRVHASVIRALHAHDVSAIVMDISFDRQRSPDGDDELARAMTDAGNVVLVERVNRLTVPGAGISTELVQGPIQQLHERAIGLGPFPLPETPLTQGFWSFRQIAAGNLPTLPSVALQVHALPFLDDFLSVLERADVQGLDELPPSVESADDLRALMLVIRQQLARDPRAVERALTLMADTAPVSLTPEERRVLLALLRLYAGANTYDFNFYGPAGTIDTVPFHILLEESAPERLDLAGRVIFVGEGASALVTSAEQQDAYPTVYSTAEGVDLSGAEVGATAFANLLTGGWIRTASPLAAIWMLFVFGALTGMMAVLVPTNYAPWLIVAVPLAWSGLAAYAFIGHLWLVPIAVPLLVQLPLALVLGLGLRLQSLRRQVPSEGYFDDRPRRSLGVCLATDVAGYTRLTERMESSGEGEGLWNLLGEYFAMLHQIVDRRGGVAWGSGGDSIVFVWQPSRTEEWLASIVLPRRIDAGLATVWPRWRDRLVQPDRRVRLSACLAALELRNAISRFNARHVPERQLPTRIGLSAGVLRTGSLRVLFHTMGTPPNEASRIEGLNKALSTTLLAPASLVRDLESIVARRVGYFQLKGISNEVEVAELLGERGAVGTAVQQLCDRFAEALDHFENGHHAAAEALFEQLVSDYGDGPARYYRDEARRQLVNLCAKSPL